jgi:hypothetical protein
MSQQPDLSWWTEETDGEIRRQLETQILSSERHGRPRVVRCERVNDRTGTRCGAKILEVRELRLNDHPEVTIRAILFRRVRQNPLGINHDQFLDRHDHASAVMQAMRDRKPSYRLREWDWTYAIDGIDVDPRRMIATACKCTGDESHLSVRRILTGEITAVGSEATRRPEGGLNRH